MFRVKYFIIKLCEPEPEPEPEPELELNFTSTKCET